MCVCVCVSEAIYDSRPAAWALHRRTPRGFVRKESRGGSTGNKAKGRREREREKKKKTKKKKSKKKKKRKWTRFAVAFMIFAPSVSLTTETKSSRERAQERVGSRERELKRERERELKRERE